MNRVTPITASAQQIMSSFGVTITAAYLTSQIKDLPAQHTVEQLRKAFGHTFWITLFISLGALVLSLFLKKTATSLKTEPKLNK